MKTYNTYFDSSEQFTAFVHAHQIVDNKRLLIQMFTSLFDKQQILTIRDTIITLFPNAVLIGATTDGEICSGRVTVGRTVISLTQFTETFLLSTLIEGEGPSLLLGKKLAYQLMKEGGTLLITFSDGTYCNGEDYLKGISEVQPELIVSGGMAGDNARFQNTYVFTEKQITSQGAVGVLLCNPELQIHTDYNFNWSPIGKLMTITQAEGNRIYTIDHIPASDIYAHYLGKDIARKLPEIGVEFPLIIQNNNYNVARAVLAKHSDGSLSFAGNFMPGDTVRFGYGDAEMILNHSLDTYTQMSTHPVESIFIYSCMARRRFMPDLIEEEILPLQQLTDVVGFFTYGEFFSGKGQSILMNQTTTILALSESPLPKYCILGKIEKKVFPIKNYQKSLKALSHLLNVTTRELGDENKRLEEKAFLLEAKKEALQRVQEIGHFGSWEVDLQTKRSVWSTTSYHIYGLDPETTHPTLETFFSLVVPEDRVRVEEALEEAYDGEIKTVCVRATHTDGRQITLQINGKLLFNEKNIPVKLVGTTLDITELVKLQSYNEELVSILEHSNNEIYIIEKGTYRYLYVNHAALKRLGYTREEMYTMNILDINKTLSVAEVKHMENHLVEKGMLFNRTVHTTKRGDTYPVQSYIQYSTYQNKEVGIIFDIDITELVKAEQKQKRQAKILEQIHDSVVSTDLEDMIMTWNHGATMIHGYTAEEMIGRSVHSLYLAEDLPYFQYMKEEALTHGFFQGEIRKQTKDGQLIYTQISISLLKDEQDEVIGLTRFTQDITEKKKIEKQLNEQAALLNYQAHHDALTALPNRILFDNRLQQAIRDAEKDKKLLGILFVDLDNFKQINDTLGHHMGDKVLKIVAKRFQNCIREKDTLARLGGDEFTLLIQGFSTAEDISAVAKKIISVLKPKIVLDNNELYITASIGISMYPQDALLKHDLLKYADTAMYKAMYEVKYAFRFYSTEMTTEALKKAEIEAGLRRALDQNELMVYYQPKIDVQQRKIIGLEALVRWEEPVLGQILPDYFISIAEESHLIVEIDQYVMLQAIKDMKAWYDAGFSPGILSLNLSLKQLMHENFMHYLLETIQKIDFKISWLEFEITESQMMDDPEKSIHILEMLNSLGAKVAIDDFGTGYSSLAHLKRFPVKTLKIDRSFIKDLPEDEEDRAITKAIIALAKSLNLEIVAEGVETEEQKAYLLENGCYYIQGYYYSKPVSKEEMTEFIKEFI